MTDEMTAAFGPIVDQFGPFVRIDTRLDWESRHPKRIRRGLRSENCGLISPYAILRVRTEMSVQATELGAKVMKMRERVYFEEDKFGERHIYEAEWELSYAR
jgi:hypothetical protein